MANPLFHPKSPNVPLLWNVSSLALTCRILKTFADETEPQFVSAWLWRGEMWKTEWRGGPQELEVYEVLIEKMSIQDDTSSCGRTGIANECSVLKSHPGDWGGFDSSGLYAFQARVGTRKTLWSLWEQHTNCWCLAAVPLASLSTYFGLIHIQSIYWFFSLYYAVSISLNSGCQKRITGNRWKHEKTGGPLPAQPQQRPRRTGRCKRSRNRCQMEWSEGKLTKGQSLFPHI